MPNKVLVAHRQNQSRSVFEMQFDDSGYILETVSNVDEMFMLLEADHRFDLVFIEQQISHTPLPSLIQKIRNANSHHYLELPIVVITSDDTFDSRKNSLHAGAIDILPEADISHRGRSISDALLQSKSRIDVNALIVDDSVTFRKVLHHSLKGVVASISDAKDGTEALQLIKSNPNFYQIIILDHEMPNMTGLELTKAIRYDLGLVDIPLIMITGTKDQHKIHDFFNFGGTDCLKKPYITEELQARIRAHVDKSRLTQEMKNYNRELRKLSRDKDDFLAACSHDLKNPLNAVLGYVELMAEDIENPTHLQDLARIHKAATVLSDLIGDIAELHRVQSVDFEPKLTPVNPNSLIHDCIELNNSLAERKGISLSYQSNNTTPSILGDSSLLKRAINNLLSNSIKFTDRGGKVEITVEHMENLVSITVHDTGLGMDDDVIRQLFQRYSPASREGTKGEQGTGLGLSITKQIVEKMRGKIKVESSIGQGSHISLFFPILDAYQTSA